MTSQKILMKCIEPYLLLHMTVGNMYEVDDLGSDLFGFIGDSGVHCVTLKKFFEPVKALVQLVTANPGELEVCARLYEAFDRCASYCAGIDKELPMPPMFWYWFGIMQGIVNEQKNKAGTGSAV